MFEKNALGKNARRMKIQYSSFTLKVIAAVMTLIGTIGVAILQNGVMNLGSYSTETLSKAFESMGKEFWLATLVIFCSGVAALALPIYSHLLLEGYKKTSSFKNYTIRIAILALISEIPYDLAMRDSWFTMYSQNPVWGLLIALVMIYFLDYFGEVKKFKGVLIRLAIVVAAILWMIMLNVSYGVGLALVTAMLWIMEGNGMLTTIAGVMASLFNFPAPFGFIFNYFYNGEKGNGNRKIFYVLYPAQLLVLGLIGKYLF